MQLESFFILVVATCIATLWVVEIRTWGIPDSYLRASYVLVVLTLLATTSVILLVRYDDLVFLQSQLPKVLALCILFLFLGGVFQPFFSQPHPGFLCLAVLAALAAATIILWLCRGTHTNRDARTDNSQSLNDETDRFRS